MSSGLPMVPSRQMRGLPLGLLFNWYTFWFWFPSFFCCFFGGLSMFGLPRVLGSFGWLIILGLPRGLRSFGGLSIFGLPRDLLYCSRGLPLFFGFSFGCSIVISLFIYLTLYIFCFIFLQTINALNYCIHFRVVIIKYYSSN